MNDDTPILTTNLASEIPVGRHRNNKSTEFLAGSEKFPWLSVTWLIMILSIMSWPLIQSSWQVGRTSSKIAVSKKVLSTSGVAGFDSHSKPLNPSEQAQWCQTLLQALKKVATFNCMSPKFFEASTQSVEKRKIVFADVAQMTKGSKKRILIMAGIHGDELSSTILAFRWLPMLQSGLGRDYEWRVVPVLNPDGMLRNPPTRVNANGVDLNRNFPMPDWVDATTAYWEIKTKKDPRRYPGKSALSEPESKWFYEEVSRFKPDVVVAIHAPYGILDFDGPVSPPDRLGPLELMRLGVYPGSLGNLALTANLSVLTVELPKSLEVPSEQAMRNMLTDLIKWVDQRMQKPKSRGGMH